MPPISQMDRIEANTRALLECISPYVTTEEARRMLGLKSTSSAVNALKRAKIKPVKHGLYSRLQVTSLR